jgi:protein phosphatase
LERIALISDIHGNMPALEGILEDIERRGIRRIFCLGDLIGKGPHSERVVDFCRIGCERVIRGNWDDALASQAIDNPTIRWHLERLGPERLAYLKSLPNTIDLIVSGRRVRLVHASPQGVYHRIRQGDPIDTLRTMFDSTDFTGDDFEPDVVGYGDIHTAFLRTFDQKILFNVGSVGNPLDLPLACYAVLEGEPHEFGPGPLGIDIVRIPYDIERAIREAAAEDMPELKEYASELRTARYRGLPA